MKYYRSHELANILLSMRDATITYKIPDFYVDRSNGDSVDYFELVNSVALIIEKDIPRIELSILEEPTK